MVAILNTQPDIVKRFNTLNYEGTKSKIDQFTEETIDGKVYTDKEYYNLTNSDGWYIDYIKTNKDEGSINEFIEKEGKWFNYIKGTYQGGTTDQSSFTFQGLGIVEKITDHGD